jgi:hypothetical protein
MIDKKSKAPSDQSESEQDMKVKQSDCGCTYLEGKKGLFIPPGGDKRQRTSWCGKSGGSSGNCDFL